jgi:hypothetical protein
MKRPKRSIVLSLAVAVVGAVGALHALALDPQRALFAWIAAYGFGLSTAIGALFLVMIFHVTNARWPIALRSLLMAIANTLPLFILLFVPIALGLDLVYPWAQDVSGLDEEVRVALEHQKLWENRGFFIARSVVYLASWSTVVTLLDGVDRAYLADPSAELVVRQRRISAAGLVVIAFTLTFASFDWFMSVESGWVSNIYGLYVFAGGFSAAISVAIIATRRAREKGLLPMSVGASHFHALGRMLLLSVIFWAYIAFFQLMLIWIGDLPREATFFVHRSRGSYVAVNVILVMGHFILPLFALLSRPLKRHAGALSLVAGWMLVMNALDFAWLVLPSAGEMLHALDVAPFLVVGGLAIAFGTWQLRAPGRVLAAAAVTKRADVDPALAESLRYRSP